MGLGSQNVRLKHGPPFPFGYRVTQGRVIVRFRATPP